MKQAARGQSAGRDCKRKKFDAGRDLHILRFTVMPIQNVEYIL
jgi:hypothetical protein